MSRRLLITALCLVLVGCGASESETSASSTGSQGTTTTESMASTTSAATDAPESTTTAIGTESGSVRDLREQFGIGVVTLRSTAEGGPHPMLAWEPVDGASAYWLVVKDADGVIYWAWTGEATSVRVGGGDSPDLNQTAALHETMTWSVTAIDESGSILAFSDNATVSP